METFPCYTYASSAALSPENYIIVHVAEEGSGTTLPLFTDTAKVNYQGRLLPSATYTSGKLFDSTWSGTLSLATSHPVKFAINDGGLSTGFATALQQMHQGDRWMVYIPYQLAYGTTDYTAPSGSSVDIPGCSVLIFDLSLVDFWHVGETEVVRK